MAREGITIVVRKDDQEDPPHHGGAWKVAYADFVTAMMAFFLLMWLINATTEDQRRGLADYFAPTNLFGHSASGSGKPFGGQTPYESGSMASTTGSLQVIKGDQPATVDRVQHDGDPLPSPADRAAPRDDALASRAVPTGDDEVAGNGHDGSRPPAAIDDANGPQSRARGGDYAAAALSPRLATAQGAAESDVVREQHALEQVANQLRTAIRQDPALADIADQFTVENTPEGLRIQITDQDRRPMFTLGSAAPTRPVRDLVQKIVPLLAGLPNAVSIAGHTDAATYRGLDMSNWELSVERANATRRLLVEGGLPDSRIRSVTGNADRDLLLPNDPLNAANRRIAIVLLRTSRAAAP